jgi:hypothetical protein
MQPTTNNTSTSYSDLPILCTSLICTHLAATGSAPLVRVRSVNQDFFQESRIPLAKSVIKELKAVDCQSLPEGENRLQVFNKYLCYVKSTNGLLPDRLRYAVLKELCRIVRSLRNQFFRDGWRDMVAQFNTESDTMRIALRADMNKAHGPEELYGDDSTGFEVKTVTEEIIEVLKAANYENIPEEKNRLLVFRKGLRYVKRSNGLPDKLRETILKELCRIVNALPNQFFNAAWRDMVAQFNTESDTMRAALRADMNKAWRGVELYGDGGTDFHFDKPMHWGL